MRISDWSSDVCSSDLRGDVVNIEQTTQAIKRAVENAEHMANCRAQSVYVGISGTHIRSLNSTGVAPVRAGSVSDRDEIGRASGRARACPDVSISGVPVSLNKKNIHTTD